jgi:hypothetical protein
LFQASIEGDAAVSAGRVVYVSADSSINGTLFVEGTLVLYAGVSLLTTDTVLSGLLNVSAMGAVVECSNSFTASPGAVLTVIVPFQPGSAPNLTVVVAEYATFLGGPFASTATIADFAYDECVFLVRQSRKGVMRASLKHFC